jgi:hypothetical protein
MMIVMDAVPRTLILAEVTLWIWKRILWFVTLEPWKKQMGLYAGKFFPMKSMMLVGTVHGVHVMVMRRADGIAT